MRRGSGALPLAAMAALDESGFVVLPGPFPVEQLGAVADAYDAEVGAAVGDDIHVGSTSTRVVDFVNRGLVVCDAGLRLSERWKCAARGSAILSARP